MNTDMLKLFSRPIAFHRIFIEWTGSVKAALFFSQLIFWSERTKNPNGWIYKTAQEWTEETGLTRKEQKLARRLLLSAKLIEEKLQGVPAQLHFRIIEKELLRRINSVTQKTGQTSFNQRAKLDLTKGPNLIGPKGQTRFDQRAKLFHRLLQENTSETTTGGSGEAVAPDPPITRFSPAVVRFSRFSREREFHILPGRNGKGEVRYVKGGQPGGWTRRTLLAWEDSYRDLARKYDPEYIEEILTGFLKWYDSEWIPEARTFISFAEKFSRIEKAVRRQRLIQERNGLSEIPDDPPSPAIKKQAREMSQEEWEDYQRNV